MRQQLERVFCNAVVERRDLNVKPLKLRVSIFDFEFVLHVGISDTTFDFNVLKEKSISWLKVYGLLERGVLL